MLRWLLLLGLLSTAALPSQAAAPSVARPVNPDDLRRRLELLPNYQNVLRLRDVTIAVLDSGFEGAGHDRPYLPKNTVLVEHYDPAFVQQHDLGDPNYRKPFPPGDTHGRVMAQLAWAMTGNSPDGPRFLLLNASGPTLFRRAVRYAIEQRADVILFSGTFEGAGNYDGRGPINAAVDDAVAAGILWVNAAGNSGSMVFNGSILTGPDRFLRFPAAGGLSSLRFRNRLDENALAITLTWNDYQPTEDAGTTKDLDLYVEDARGNVVGKSELTQIPAGRPTGEGETKNPRERLMLTDLPASPEGQEYRIRVKARSANFGPRDTIRILLTPVRNNPLTDPATGKPVRPIEFLDASRGGEIYPPADHAGVLTVGDTSPESAVGPTADGRTKPDVILSDSTARLTNGQETAGSSNAAAYFAGVLAVLRAMEPRLTTGHVRDWVRVLDREAALAQQPAPRFSVVAPPPLPQAVVPLSPNQQRAFRYAEGAVAEQRAKGLPAPGVWITSRSGEVLVTPGQTPRLPAPMLPARPKAIVPVDATLPAKSPSLHAPWRTPSPRALTDLVRGRP